MESDSLSNPAINTPRSSPAGMWVMGAAFPLMLVGLGVMAFVRRRAYVPGQHYSTTRPLEVVGAQATGYGLALFGVAVLLNSIFFDIGGRPESKWSTALILTGLLLLFGGLFDMVFSF
jgi:hypothetical protein